CALPILLRARGRSKMKIAKGGCVEHDNGTANLLQASVELGGCRAVVTYKRTTHGTGGERRKAVSPPERAGVTLFGLSRPERPPCRRRRRKCPKCCRRAGSPP